MKLCLFDYRVKNPYCIDAGVFVQLDLPRHLVRCVARRNYLHHQLRNNPEDPVRIDISDLRSGHKRDIGNPYRARPKLEQRFGRRLTQSLAGGNPRSGILSLSRTRLCRKSFGDT